MLDGSAAPDLRQSLELLAISLGLGGLVGLQRQQAESRIAGIRTFPLITVLGTISGLVALANPTVGACLVVVGMVGVIAASGLGNYLRARPWTEAPGPDGKEKGSGTGITTEMAILVMYAVGVYLVYGFKVVAICVTGVIVLLLYSKDLLHRFVRSLGEKDVRGIMQFVLLACVILPVLPDQDFGPYDALNARNIWLVVVLVVGISLGGYVAYRVVGERAGTVVSGVLGGLISSTATTASFARRSRESGRNANAAMVAILLASSVLYGRVIIELSAVAAKQLPAMLGPLLTLAGVTVLMTLLLLAKRRTSDDGMPAPQNPTNLGAALLFALIYTAVVLATALAKDYMPSRGLYVVAAISGLPDLDAITLSTGRSVGNGEISPDTGWRAVMIALLSSMVMKLFICGTLGNRTLLKRALLLFGINIAAGLLILLLWPKGTPG
jgi:uncharacterized membrane protein (DUF4010 family)